jgi:hypothetical protein
MHKARYHLEESSESASGRIVICTLTLLTLTLLSSVLGAESGIRRASRPQSELGNRHRQLSNVHRLRYAPAAHRHQYLAPALTSVITRTKC